MNEINFISKKGVDYSTIERDYPGNATSSEGIGSSSRENTLNNRDGERRSLTNNRYEGASDINTRNMRGPNTYKGSDLNLIGPGDLPNIDINKSSSQQQQPQQTSNRSYQGPGGGTGGSYNARTSYQNAPLDAPFRSDYDSQTPQTSSMRDSGGMIPPPPAKGPVNKIQFPSRNQPPQQSQSQSRPFSSS
jgi:hypothetical protein